MDNLISIVWVIIEQFSLLLLRESFFEAKCSIFRHRMINICGILILLLLIFWPPAVPMFVCSIIVNIGISFLVYRGNPLQMIVTVILSAFFLTAGDMIFIYGCCAFLRLPLEEFYELRLLYVVVATADKLFFLLLTWLIHRYRSNFQNKNYKGRWLALSLIFPLFSMIGLAIIFTAFRKSTDLSLGAFLFSLALTIANIAVLLLISALEKAVESSQTAMLLNQQMRIQEKNIHVLEENYHKQRESAHEFQNIMLTVANLIDSEEYDSLKDYIKETTQMHSIRVMSINSHHSIIDAILNEKYQYAKAHDIDFQVQVNNLSSVAIPSNFLVVLLSNLLDNAIEACECYPGTPEIKCSLVLDTSFYIALENTSNPVEIRGNRIPSTKEDSVNHGYGISNIQKILKCLNAEYTFYYSDGFFHFVIEIPQ